MYYKKLCHGDFLLVMVFKLIRKMIKEILLVIFFSLCQWFGSTLFVGDLDSMEESMEMIVDGLGLWQR